MFVRKIRIHNFKSIYDTLELDFQDIRGFWRINGPVGSGKTTIGEAIIYGLFGDIKGKNNKDLISWGEKHCLIELWCRTKNHDLYIRREINSYLQSPIYVEVDGDELAFTNKRDAQTQLEMEYYDISRITLELLCIISFNNFKSLATLNTYDSKQFLDQVFGFYILTNYVEKCKISKQEARQQRRDIDSDINAVNSQIDKIKQLSNIQRIEGDKNLIKQEIDLLNFKLEQIKNECQNNERLYEDEINKISSEVTRIQSLGTNKAKEIKFIERGICPTCGATIDQSQLEIKRQEKELLSKQWKEENVKLNAKKEERKKIFIDYQNYINDYNKQIKIKQKILIQLEEQEKRLFINKEEIKDLKNQLNNLEINRDFYNKEEIEWDQLINILSIDIRNDILSSFIPILNNSIHEYTTQFKLPYIIEFDKNFKCSISLYGINKDISINSLSTGQLKVVDISIILGVLKVITNNSNFNICLLDELLSNMDADLRQLICSVLKNNIKEDKTVFIISHTEFEDKNFDGVIETRLQYRDNNFKKSIYNILKT